MYEDFYGLKRKPFNIVPDPEFLFLTPKHQNALTYLEYGIKESLGFILLTGEVGAGKTTLIRHILNQIESEMSVAFIFNTNVTAEQFLCIVLHAFELTSEKDNKAGNLDVLYQFLVDNYTKGKRVLLIIDEAQNLSDEVLEEIRMLSNLQTDEQMLLQIMLVGQPELKLRLRKPGLSQFIQRTTVNYHLSGLSKEEVEQYISFRLQKAGGNPDLMSPEAKALIHSASRGIPRAINILCDTALVYGFADELEVIDVPLIEQVIKDRDVMIKDDESGNDDTQSLLESDKGWNDAVPARLRSLEDKINKLQMQTEWQLAQLEQRADGFKDELVQKLKNFIKQERQRNDKLLSDYSKLRLKYDLLLRVHSKNKKK